MTEHKINEECLLLLINNNGLIDTTTIDIDNHFEEETVHLKKLCEGSNDNIIQITQFINNTLKPKLPNKTFNYCKELDKAFQSVYVNVEKEIQEIFKSRELIFTNREIANKEKKNFNLDENIDELKSKIFQRIELWFKVFNIDFAYQKAKKVPNMLVYSHRISGWSNPEYKITENLKQQVKTNFGYGSVSYFYSLLIFKNIQIIPLSEWIDYRYSKFSEVIRYTKNFSYKIPVFDEKDRIRYFKTVILNSNWKNALEFTKNAANLTLTNEQEFINKYIISECEKMVCGLEVFFKETEFDFIDETQIKIENEKIEKRRVDIRGYELIEFRTEKIIGALDFIQKLNEYNVIFSTSEYTKKIINLNKNFIPNVYLELDNQNLKLRNAREDYNIFIKEHNKLIEKENFYKNEKIKLKNEFDIKYKVEYTEFHKILTNSIEELEYHKHKIKLHTENVTKLNSYTQKYNEIVDNKINFSWEFILEHNFFFNQLFSTFNNFSEIELLKYSQKIEIGSPMLADIYHTIQPTIFGLIYNTNVRWSDDLKNKYYKEPKLLKVTENADIYSYKIIFDELPLSIMCEIENNKSFKINRIIDEFIPNNDDFTQLNNSIENIENEINVITSKSNFSDEELLYIIKSSDNKYFCNIKFYESIMNKIQNDIKTFKVIDFYEKI